MQYVKGTVFINAVIGSPIWNPQVVHMPRAYGSHSRWKQHYWGDYTLRKGSLSFWDQFLANVPFSVFTWRVWIARTSDFITEVLTRSEHLLKRSCFFREMPVAMLGESILQTEAPYWENWLPFLLSKKEPHVSFFVCVVHPLIWTVECYSPIAKKSVQMEECCSLASSPDVWSEMPAIEYLSWKCKGHVKSLFRICQM